MIRKATELKFISQIERDGSGVKEITTEHLEHLLKFNEGYTLSSLSLTEQTFIASNFNVYVVKIKPITIEQIKPKTTMELLDMLYDNHDRLLRCPNDSISKAITSEIRKILWDRVRLKTK